MLGNYDGAKIKITNDYHLLKFEKQHIPEITEFVANIFFEQKHYSFEHSLSQLCFEMNKKDEHLYENTTLFCIVNSEDEVCCTARLIKRIDSLPFEDEFNIDLNLFNDKVKHIYEFARFASNRKIPFFVIEKMLRIMLNSIKVEESLVVASLDKLVFKKFIRIKYPIYKLGLPIQYLGSLTLPVAINLSELSFYPPKASKEAQVCK